MVMPTDPMLWHKVAAVSGVAALGLGTYGAHMFRPQNPRCKEVWQTASLYHLVHTAALLGAPITKRPNVFGGLLTAGIVLFSGTSGKGKGQENGSLTRVMGSLCNLNHQFYGRYGLFLAQQKRDEYCAGN